MIHNFKRIEFQHRDNLHDIFFHDNALKHILNNNKDIIKIINELVFVSQKVASGNIKLQKHKHIFCYKKLDPNKKDNYQ